MNENIKKRMTPRQRCAIANPIADHSAVPHVRHHRRNGHVQSILTFDASEISSLVDPDSSVLNRVVDGWFGVWHARVSMVPVRLLVAWNNTAIAEAQGVITRLVAGVGIAEDTEVHNGSDLKSIHVYKWATPAELAHAASECGSFEKLKAMSRSADVQR